jgi:hypothetical protein
LNINTWAAPRFELPTFDSEEAMLPIEPHRLLLMEANMPDDKTFVGIKKCPKFANLEQFSFLFIWLWLK